MPRAKRASNAALKELREYGLGYPGAHLKSPWPGHLDLAVKDKTFAYLSLEGEPFGISCKLPRSCHAALMLPFASPAGWGLGKSGWVSAQIAEGETLPLDLFFYEKDSLKPGLKKRIGQDDPYYRTISDGWSNALKNAFKSLPDFSEG